MKLKKILVLAICFLMCFSSFGLGLSFLGKKAETTDSADSDWISIDEIWNNGIVTSNFDTLLQKIANSTSVNSSNFSKIDTLAGQNKNASYFRENNKKDIKVKINGYEFTPVYMDKYDYSTKFLGLTSHYQGSVLTLMMTDSNQLAYKTIYTPGEFKDEDLYLPYGITSFGANGTCKFSLYESNDSDERTNAYQTSYVAAMCLQRAIKYCWIDDVKDASSPRGKYVLNEGNLTTLTPSNWGNKFLDENLLGENGGTSFGGYLRAPYRVPYQDEESTKDILGWAKDCSNENYKSAWGSYYSAANNYNNIYKSGSIYSLGWENKLWLPSISELGYSGVTETGWGELNGSTSAKTGLWGLSDLQRGNSTQYWTRTANWQMFDRVYCVTSAGKLNSANVSTSQGVRPCIHIDLTVMAENRRKNTEVTITANAGTNGSITGANELTNGWLGNKKFIASGAIGTLPSVSANTGYEFLGWFDSPTGGNKIETTTKFTSNATIYAQYQARECTVTFDKNGGEGGTGKAYPTIGKPMPPIDLPTYEGYTFQGYFDSTKGGTQYYTASGMGAKDWDKNVTAATLYAQWTANDQTLTLDLDGGSYSSTPSGWSKSSSTKYTKTIKTDAYTDPPPDPTRTGYSFIGWEKQLPSMKGEFGTLTQEGDSLDAFPELYPYFSFDWSTAYYQYLMNTNPEYNEELAWGDFDYKLSYEWGFGSVDYYDYDLSGQLSLSWDMTDNSSYIPLRVAGNAVKGNDLAWDDLLPGFRIYRKYLGDAGFYDADALCSIEFNVPEPTVNVAGWRVIFYPDDYYQRQEYEIIGDNVPDEISSNVSVYTGLDGTEFELWDIPLDFLILPILQSAATTGKFIPYFSTPPQYTMNITNLFSIDLDINTWPTNFYAFKMGPSATTLVAQWKPNTYTLKLNANGGTFTSEPSGWTKSNDNKTLSYLATYGTTFDLPAMVTYDATSGDPTINITRAGYLFKGWSQTNGATSAEVLDRLTGLQNLTSENGGTYTYYAVWEDTWAVSAEAPSIGDGTSSSPYQISSAYNLAWIAAQINYGANYKEFVSAHYEQTGNITLSNRIWLPIGESSTRCFKGTYDGKGYAIIGLNTLDQTNAAGNQLYSNVGLFGQTNSATIKNIDLLDANVYGNNRVGSLVGMAFGGSVTNCRVNGNVTGTGDGVGMIGETSKTLVKACYNSGTITGGNYAGGLIGNMNGSSMISSGFEGTVSGTSAGLMVGNLASSTTIQDCFGYYQKTENEDAPKIKGISVKSGTVKTCIYHNGSNGYYIGSGFTNWVYDDGCKKFLPGDLTWIGGCGAGNAVSKLSGLGYKSATQ